MPEPISIRIARASDRKQLARLWREAIDEGALPGFNPNDVERLVERIAISPEAVMVAADGGDLRAFLDLEAHVIVVRHESRRRGIGRELVAFAERRLRDGGVPLLLWLPEGNSGAAAFLAAIGFGYVASLWQLRLDGIAGAACPQVPDEFELVTVDRVAVADFVALFNEAFTEHPTPLQVTPELVAWVHARPEFDPAEIGVLRTAASGELVGFCRTRGDDPSEPGEIALIGVRPAWRGRGLGQFLLRWGIARLAARGHERAELSVESENEAALVLYERAGFRRTFEWRRFGRISSSPS